jgi:hypothetical protein
MSPTSYQTAPPRINIVSITSLSLIIIKRKNSPLEALGSGLR